MIDLTPLDVRKKRGDFRRMLRGYDPQEVDSFIELVAERLEGLVKDNLALSERIEHLTEQVKGQQGRETAIHEALVSAQTLREEISQQASRDAEAVKEHANKEAELVRTHAQAEAKQMVQQAEAEVSQIRTQAVGDTELLRKKTEDELERLTAELEGLIGAKTGLIEELDRKRTRFLRAFRSLLERELDGVAIEEGKLASEDAVLELDLTGGQRRVQARMIETAALDLLVDQEVAAGATAPPVESVVEFEAEPSEAEAAIDSAPESALEVESVENEEPTAELQGAIEVENLVQVDQAPTFEVAPSAEADLANADLPQATEVKLVDEDFRVDEKVAAAETIVIDVEAEASETDTSENGAEPPRVAASLEALDLTIADSGEDASLNRTLGELSDAGAVDAPPPSEDSAESLVDRVLKDRDEVADDEGVIPIGTLAPEEGAASADSLDEDARAVVNQLFDRDDVPLSAPSDSDGEVEDAWSKVLRGDDVESAGPQASSPDSESPKGNWAPNFPDKNKQEGATGWSRSRDQSRWR